MGLIKKLAGFVCRGPITRKLQPPLNRGSAWKVYTRHAAFVSCCQTGGWSEWGRGSARGHPLLPCECRALASLGDLDQTSLLQGESREQTGGWSPNDGLEGERGRQTASWERALGLPPRTGESPASGTTSPRLASTQPREESRPGRCSRNLENNFSLVGYCGRPYLEQSY